MREEITKEILDERYVFNLETGIVTNRVKTAKHTRIGKEAGYLRLDGYRQICINGRNYLTARLIWLYAKGEWPINIDHINHRRDDNRLINLRSVSQAENHKNRSKNSNNTSGVMGVSWYKPGNKWVARITVNGTRVTLGSFTDLADAITARSDAKVEHGYHCNHA